jgi:hypothetical protein
VLTGIRSALAVAITSALWFATAWPNGPVAVVVAAVVRSLLASLEQPAFNSPCRRSQTLRRDAELVSRPKEQATRPRVLLSVNHVVLTVDR